MSRTFPSSTPGAAAVALTVVLEESEWTPDIDGGSIRAAALRALSGAWARLEEDEPLCWHSSSFSAGVQPLPDDTPSQQPRRDGTAPPARRGCRTKCF